MADQSKNHPVVYGRHQQLQVHKRVLTLGSCHLKYSFGQVLTAFPCSISLFIVDHHSGLLRSTMRSLSYRWRRLVTEHQSNHLDQSILWITFIFQDLSSIHSIICLNPEVLLAPTMASPTSLCFYSFSPGLVAASLIYSFFLVSYDIKYRVVFLTGPPLKMSLDWPPPNLLGLAPP